MGRSRVDTDLVDENTREQILDGEDLGEDDEVGRDDVGGNAGEDDDEEAVKNGVILGEKKEPT